MSSKIVEEMARDEAIAKEETSVSEKEYSVPLYNAHMDVSHIDEKKLLRKMDLWLIPWLSFLYLLSFLDRTSIGNAKLYGMTTDLHMTSNQYSVALTIFFFSYALFEVPSNVFLKRLKPSIWLSFLMVAWGIVMMCQGLAKNDAQLLALRWLLGMFEAGLFPGVNASFYLSCWYKRSEFGIRSAIFFSAASVSGAFGGLLAAGISQMKGIGGKAGWSWIFIIEGLVTIVAGIVSFWIIQDFPDNAKFLTEEERTVVIRRLQEDDQYSAAGETLKMKSIFMAIKDWKTWLSMIVYTGVDGPLYAFALFLPTIINQLGYTANPANLLTVPVYVVASIVTCGVGFYADRKGRRGFLNVFFLCLAGAGYIILAVSRNPTLSYVAVYLAACGIYPIISNSVAWAANNVEGTYKRSVTMAMQIGFGNINGAVSSNVYRAQNAPWYTMGHGIVLAYIGMGIISSLAYIFLLKAENARRDRGERDEIIEGINDQGDQETVERLARLNGRYSSVEEAKKAKGDEWSGYRYTL